MAVTYRAKCGHEQFKPELGKDFTEADMHDDDKGWCLACGRINEGVEPNARRGKCEHCEAPKVYGLGELALMGLIVVPEGA